MTDDFNNKLADLIWSLIEPKIEQKLNNFRDDLGTFDGDLDEKINDWMCGKFQPEDYSHEIDGMIDVQVQYLAENGDLKEWLDNGTDEDVLRLKVIDIISDITVGFNVK